MLGTLRIAVVANTAWNIYNFRRNLMQALRAAGHKVIIAAPPDATVSLLEADGFTYRPFPLSGSGINPLRETCSVLALRRILMTHRVNVVLSFTPKANIYVGLALTGLPTVQIANISGLGHTFVKPSALTLLVKFLYRIILRDAANVFFQNDDDRQAFIAMGLVGAEKTECIPGSGIDLTRFVPQSFFTREVTEFLLVARMLWDKGIGEFVNAARLVQSRHPKTRFRLLGGFSDNPSAIPRTQIEAWVREGLIEYAGEVDDVRPLLTMADCVVLPSYREGIPRSLLEAAAMTKPLITTDVPGCRCVVEDGVTGYLCRARDPIDLSVKMMTFLTLSAQERAVMGQRGRKKMEREFDEQLVIERYLATVAQLVIADPVPDDLPAQ